LTGFLDDLQYGVRFLLRRPALSAALVLTLAVGIGANAGMFAAVSTVLLHPLPLREPDGLAVLWAADRKHADQQVEVSFADLKAWRRRSRTFQGFAALSSVNLDVALTGDGRPQQIESMLVSDGFFDVLGAKAMLGRVPAAKDRRDDNTYTGVISRRLWLSRYGGDPGIVGRVITADHAPVTIVGVMPDDFDFPHNVDFWYPAPDSQLNANADIRVYRVIARLAPGRTVEQGRAEMEAIAQALERESPEQHRGLGVRVESFAEAVYGNARPALWGLMAAVGLLLAAACVNAANLLLSRANSRRNEMRLRAALGAGQGRVIRQVLTEAIPVAAFSATIGLTLAHFGVKLLAALAPKDIPRLAEAAISGAVFAYSAGITLAAVLLFALPGAFAAARGSLVPRKVARNRLRGAFVIGQVAVSVVLIASALTLAAGFAARSRIDPGFRREHVLSFRLTLSKPEHTSQEARKRFYQDVLERLRQIPGVQSAAAVLLRPLAGTVGWDTGFSVAGQDAEQARANPAANYEAISPDYFRTMGIRLIAGRDFGADDRANTEPVAMVSAALARRYFPAGAVGQRIRLSAKSPWLRIVGVTADVRYREWDAARFDIYIPFQQRAQHRSDFVLRTAQTPLALTREIERAVAAVDKDQPVSSLTTVDAIVDETFALPRFQLTLAGVFAVCALLVAGTGLFAVLMQAMTERRREIGIRIAIGAARGDVIRLVLREGLGLAGAGVAIGAAASFAGLQAGGLTLAYTAIAVLAAAVLAAALPAMRAAAVNPVDTLRHE
jgi:putative ABC transport system permease protein